MKFSDFTPGQTLVFGPETITEAEILAFARHYDPQWFHTNPARAAASRWNKVIESHGLPFRLVAPHKGFNRKIGSFAGFAVTPTGSIIDPETWRAGANGWLPSASDREFVMSLMRRTTEPGKFASFIAPPVAGINRQPLDFPYVRSN